MIFAKTVDFQRENLSYSPKWGISEEKTRDFKLDGGFSKRKRVIFA